MAEADRLESKGEAVDVPLQRGEPTNVVPLDPVSINVGNLTQDTDRKLDEVFRRLGINKEEAGYHVASLFLRIFMVALLGMYLLIGIVIWKSTSELSDKVFDVFKTTLATFSSLLAFVLGYYFGQHKQ